jgi:hypothetical protein
LSAPRAYVGQGQASRLMQPGLGQKGDDESVMETFSQSLATRCRGIARLGATVWHQILFFREINCCNLVRKAIESRAWAKGFLGSPGGGFIPP